MGNHAEAKTLRNTLASTSTKTLVGMTTVESVRTIFPPWDLCGFLENIYIIFIEERFCRVPIVPKKGSFVDTPARS